MLNKKNMANQKLELNWIGKGNEPRLEPRILIENPEYSVVPPIVPPNSFGEHTDTSNKFDGTIDGTGLLIHGDNLLALKALEQDFAGKVKCIYIDPPYNTGNAFTHYDDGIEHSLWLSLIKPRLEILRSLLSTDGSIWISIDDDESHYLKVLCDEVFGRKNFVANVIWEKKYSPSNDAKWLSDSHDHILVYAKNKEIWRPNLLPRGDKQNAYYKYNDNDGRGLWRSDNVLVKSFSPSGVFAIINPITGKEYFPTKGSCYRFNEETAKRYLIENRFYFGKDGKGAPQLKRYLSEVKDGVTVKTIWIRDEVGDNQEAKKEIKVFNSEDVFATPKPERLIERILFLSTNPNDLVLDSFLGSGTTAAVAHKMGRRWIGIELGDHAITHCVPRLCAVCNGSDQGGISKTVAWKGGGGFRYYTLAPTLITKDAFEQDVINPEYNATMLAAAVAKHEGFRYSPDAVYYWKQSQSVEGNYCYVTTQFVSRPLLESINESLQEHEHLLICCSQYEEGIAKVFPNIRLKKIPHILLGKCEYKADSDYSFKIVNVPMEHEVPPNSFGEIDASNEFDGTAKNKNTQQSLF